MLFILEHNQKILSQMLGKPPPSALFLHSEEAALWYTINTLEDMHSNTRLVQHFASVRMEEWNQRKGIHYTAVAKQKLVRSAINHHHYFVWYRQWCRNNIWRCKRRMKSPVLYNKFKQSAQNKHEMKAMKYQAVIRTSSKFGKRWKVKMKSWTAGISENQNID